MQGPYLSFYPALTGTQKLQKRGIGLLNLHGNAGVPTHSGGIDVVAGSLCGVASARFGTGAITMSAGTELSNFSAGTPLSLSNTLNILGNVTLNDLAYYGAVSRGTMTLTGTVNLPAVTPTLNIGGASANHVAISGPITGTAGFTKAGAGALTISGAAKALDTTTPGSSVTVSTGILTLNPASNLPNVGAFNVAGTLWYTYTADTLISAGTTYAGAGSLLVYKDTASDPTTGVSFPAGALAGLTGTAANLGLQMYGVTANANTRVTRATIRDLPRRISFSLDTGSGSAGSQVITFTGTGVTSLTDAYIWVSANTALTASSTFKLASEAATNPLVLQGGVTSEATGAAGTRTFTIGGTSALDNAIQGVISNGVGTLGITKSDAGRWILSGANTYTGTTSISAGTLSAQNATAFGGSGAVTQTGGTIEVTGGTALNKAGAALTLVSAAGANALSSPTGANSIACAGVTLSSTAIVDVASGASLTLNNTAAMSGPFGITKNNSGEIGLGTFANTYTGAVTVAAGTLAVGNLQNTSTASSLGTGALSSAIALTGTLKYNGTGHSTNRSLTFTGAAPALDASGSGAVTYSAATQAAGARTITFTGSSTAANTLSAALSDGTGAVSVAKSGAGKWVLSNATLNYTGTTSCAGGTLNFGAANRTLGGALSISDGTIENSTNTISANTTMTGGTITAELTGNKTLDVNSGAAATLQPTNNANSFSGATTVAAGGILRLITAANPTTANAGRVLGTSAVSVSGDIKTSATGAQRGQMRYGGNLTFNTGAKLYVGGA